MRPFWLQCSALQGAGWVCENLERVRCGAIQFNSIIFWHIEVKLRMVLQNYVILKPIRFEKPSVKIIFNLLTQRYWGINTPLSDLLYCLSYYISPYIKTCILQEYGFEGYTKFGQYSKMYHGRHYGSLRPFCSPWEIRHVYLFSGIVE